MEDRRNEEINPSYVTVAHGSESSSNNNYVNDSEIDTNDFDTIDQDSLHVEARFSETGKNNEVTLDSREPKPRWNYHLNIENSSKYKGDSKRTVPRDDYAFEYIIKIFRRVSAQYYQGKSGIYDIIFNEYKINKETLLEYLSVRVGSEKNRKFPNIKSEYFRRANNKFKEKLFGYKYSRELYIKFIDAYFKNIMGCKKGKISEFMTEKKKELSKDPNNKTVIDICTKLSGKFKYYSCQNHDASCLQRWEKILKKYLEFYIVKKRGRSAKNSKIVNGETTTVEHETTPKKRGSSKKNPKKGNDETTTEEHETTPKKRERPKTNITKKPKKVAKISS